MATKRHGEDTRSSRDRHLDRRAFLVVATSAGAAATVSGAGLGVAAKTGAVALPVPGLALLSVPAGTLSVQQRQAMVAGITMVLTDVTRAGPAGLPYVTVLVVEAAEGGWGVAGHGYVRSEFSELVAGRPAQSDAKPNGVR